MSNIQKFGGITIAFFLGGLSAWVLFDSIKADNHNARPLNSRTENIAENVALKNENIALKNKVRELEEKNGERTKIANSTKPINDQSTLSTQAATVDQQIIQRELTHYKLNEISKTIKEKIDGDINSYSSKINKDFLNEEEDAFWSEKEESKLRNFISQDTELNDIALRDVECKSSQCKITFFTSGADQNQLLFEKITNTINKHYGNPSYYSDPLESGDLKTIYLKVM